ncbi:uncharacterized protein LOC127251498 [Andrographis paniculata]|uniref:uncharacterized protein LOC127251498 n=1 Tax=Andrographis paniculata TaxID=175694 RepID=UPI0021E76DE2|nr:uncharacterized protein LOC127251498 [Andrographis paniculata]XP_051131175.1 uncharacterized protein LOC127251498 [Andrographis paniculata]XP_051131176.1 uncharacterized protein LOC127251498 [Andrographis paniculata]
MTASASSEDDVVELEAMRKDTISWHPCQVSLCSSGLGLLVQYEDNNLEEMISDKDGVIACIRVRSTPLQGDDCTLLQKGDRVLATRNSRVKGDFHDALVEEAIRLRHSKRINCRCSFKMKWLNQAIEEKATTVPASAVRKLSTKNIVLHPTISTFFSNLESSNGFTRSPFLFSFDNMKLEVDISMLLEKQIEDINKSSDGLEKKLSNNLAFGLKGDLDEESHIFAYGASLKDQYMGTEKRQSLERKQEDSSDFVLLNQDQWKEGRSPLSPLAARAALALLRSSFTQNGEHSDSSNTTTDKRDLYRSASVFSSETDANISRKASATSGSRSKKLESIAKTLFPSSPPEIKVSNASPGAQGNGIGKKRKNTEKSTIQQPSEKRVTRSQVQREAAIQESKSTNVQLRPPPKSHKLTCSNDHKELNPSAEDNAETKFGIPPSNSIRPQSCFSDAKKTVSSPFRGDQEMDLTDTAENVLIPKVDTHENNSCRRITRSASAREGKENGPSISKHDGNKTTQNTGTIGVSSEGRRRQEARTSQPIFLPRTRSQTKA